MRQLPLDVEQLNNEKTINNEEEGIVEQISESKHLFRLLPWTTKAYVLKGLLYGVLLLVIVGILYCMISLQLFYYRVDLLIDRSEYEKAIQQYASIQWLPLMKHETTEHKLRTIYLAGKWQDLKQEADEAISGWYHQSPTAWYYKGVAEYMLDMMTECELSLVYSANLDNKSRARVLLYMISGQKKSENFFLTLEQL